MAGQAHKNLVWWKREMEKQSIYHYAMLQVSFIMTNYL